MKNVSRMLGGAALCAIAVMNIAGAANANEQKPDGAITATPCSVAVVQMDEDMIAQPLEVLAEAQTVQIDYDEETGKSRYSLDGGKTWSEFADDEAVQFAAEGDGNITYSVTTVPSTPTE